MKEADLYPPVKAYLETQGFEVKAEVGALDVMACRGDDPPLVVELKTSLTLTLILQGVARQSLFDDVYLAVPQPPKWTHRYRDLLALLRRLGLGLLTVNDGQVTAHLDPAPYQPRQNARRAGHLLREFQRRVGDPNVGGTTKTRRMTAYRQDALRCAHALACLGASRAAVVAQAAQVARAATLMRDDHYGWFERVARGTYALTPTGTHALAGAAGDLAALIPGLAPPAPLPSGDDCG